MSKESSEYPYHQLEEVGPIGQQEGKQSRSVTSNENGAVQEHHSHSIEIPEVASHILSYLSLFSQSRFAAINHACFRQTVESMFGNEILYCRKIRGQVDVLKKNGSFNKEVEEQIKQLTNKKKAMISRLSQEIEKKIQKLSKGIYAKFIEGLDPNYSINAAQKNKIKSSAYNFLLQAMIVKLNGCEQLPVTTDSLVKVLETKFVVTEHVNSYPSIIELAKWRTKNANDLLLLLQTTMSEEADLDDDKPYVYPATCKTCCCSFIITPFLLSLLYWTIPPSNYSVKTFFIIFGSVIGGIVSIFILLSAWSKMMQLWRNQKIKSQASAAINNLTADDLRKELSAWNLMVVALLDLHNTKVESVSSTSSSSFFGSISNSSTDECCIKMDEGDVADNEKTF